MAGYFLLDWFIIAVSLANVIMLLWLGVTILLNAEKRTLGVWLAGGGSLLGAAFFISHSAIIGYGLDLNYFSSRLNFWWRVGWIPVIALPFAWYAVMLWYTGLWDNNQHKPGLPNQQRGWLLCTFLMLVGLVGWLIFASPLPSFTQIAQFQLSAAPAVGGVPIFLVVFPLYILLCIGLALNVLRHPASSVRIMGDQARRRARPWLLATTMVLLLVSLLVAGVIAWILLGAVQDKLSGHYKSISFAVAWFDLVISSLIALSTVLLGQAIVAYEIFTGKALPRRELQRQWHNAVILAFGYGLVVGWSLTLQVGPIYTLLLTTILMTLFYALLSWRSYAWRERYIRHLRPFVTSQHLYEHLLGPKAPSDVDVAIPFQALCEDVLEVKQAYLLPLGPLAPLVKPLSHPRRRDVPHLSQPDLAKMAYSPRTLFVPLDSAEKEDLLWAVPLWSERGLIGAFIFGPKRDGGVYTQEEIEIARASGERLIDTRASAEIGQRLMALQRQRLAESQLLDRQTRRVLHDDVLPELHTAMLGLSDPSNQTSVATAEAIQRLTQAHQKISDLLRHMPSTTVPTLARHGLIGALQRVIIDELADVFDAVTWNIDDSSDDAVRRLPSLTAEVLFYAVREAIRNAAHHGRNGDSHRPLNLLVSIENCSGLSIRVEDDGVGIDTPKPAGGGSGQGLALHSAMLAVVGGILDVESVVDAYTRVTVVLPPMAGDPSGLSVSA